MGELNATKHATDECKMHMDTSGGEQNSEHDVRKSTRDIRECCLPFPRFSTSALFIVRILLIWSLR